jgi:hypothetical protein
VFFGVFVHVDVDVLFAATAFLFRQLKSLVLRKKNGLKLWGEFLKAISTFLSN